MKKILLKVTALALIFTHIFTVCFRDMSFAQEESASKGSAAKDTAADSRASANEQASSPTNKPLQAPVTIEPPPIVPPPTTLTPFSYGGASVSYAYQTNVSTGKANLSLSFLLPPGRKGLQPSLGISYENNQGNSLLGVGWSLDLGSISRSTKNGLPKYNSEDTFVFASQELVKISEREYRPKIESDFVRCVFFGNWWEVTDKAGKIYRYGYNSDSRQEFPGLGVFKWCLDRVTDSSGNYIQFSYQSDQGEIYPYKIEYTGYNDQPPLNGRVEFVLEPRPDATISYRAKSKVVVAKRLKEILIHQGQALARGYEFNYSISNSTSRSILSSVVQYTKDEKGQRFSLPPSSFSYAESNPSWQEDSAWVTSDLSFVRTDQTGGTVHSSYTNRDQGRRLFDINGDGLTDLVVGNISPYENRIVTLLNTGKGWELKDQEAWRISTGAFTYNFKDNGRTVVDLNGDGMSDYVAALSWNSSGEFKETWLNTRASSRWVKAPNYNIPDGFITDVSWQNWPSSYDLSSDQGRRFADLNADGLSDFLVAKDNYRAVYLNTGSGWQKDSVWGLPSGDNFIANKLDQGVRLLDVNGDGLSDILIAKDGQHSCYLNTGSGFIQDDSWNIPYGLDFVKDNRDGALWFADLNGDGLVDLTCAKADFKTSYINTGSGWKKDDRYNISDGSFIDQDGKDQGRRLSDVNGDGVADLLVGFNDYKKAYIDASPVSDMLKSFDNGLGAKTTLSYISSTSYDNKGQDNEQDLPFIVWTVSKVTSEDGLGNSYETKYEYKGGYFDSGEREFRGFSYAKVLDAEGNFSESYFKQDNLFKGRLYKEEKKDSSGKLYAKTENTWKSSEVYPGVNFVYLEKTDNFIYDADTTYKQTQVRFEYDPYGNPIKVISGGDVGVSGDEKTQVTEYTYNTKDWFVATPKHSYLLDAKQNKAAEKWFYYDSAASIDAVPVKGLLTKEESWLYNPLTKDETKVSSTYVYDSYGNLSKATDALGNSTSTEYENDLHSYPFKVTNSLGQSVQSTYDYKTGQVLTTTDLNNQTTANIYDAFGRLTKVIGPNDTIDYPAAIYEYDLTVKPVKITKKAKIDYTATPNYLSSYSFYDGLGRLVETKSPAEPDPDTKQARQIISGIAKFDSRGQVKEKYLPYFSDESQDYVTPTYTTPHTSFTYDPIGRLIKADNPDSTYSNIIYSDWTKTVFDENGHKQVSYSDAYGRITKIEEYLGTDGRSPQYPKQDYALYSATLYEYDTQGNLTKLTDNQDNITQVWYDSLGRKLQMNEPDMGLWKYEYDVVGNLKKQTDAKAQVLTFEYDALNRLTKKWGQSPAGTVPIFSVEYSYDDTSKPNCIGRLSKVTDSSGSTEFFYDNIGREIKSIKNIGLSAYGVERQYDALDRLVKLTYPDNSIVQYAYNPQGIEKVYSNESEGYISNIDYTPTGQINKIQYTNGTETNYSYDPKTLRLTNLTTQSPQAKIQGIDYHFDSLGNVESITDYVNTASQSFIYDHLNRLTSATGSYGSFNYEYDSIGNMLNKEGISLTYGKNNKLPHAVTQYGNTAIDYDANGNMIKKANLELTYDAENRLTKLEDKSVTQSSQSKTITLTLKPGWNFISLPVIPKDTKISSVFSTIAGKFDQVSRYNPDKNKFEHYVGNAKYDQFDSLEYARGYQVYINTSTTQTLAVTGSLPEGRQIIQLKAGKNLIFSPKSAETQVETALSPLKIGIDYSKVLYYDNIQGKFREYSVNKQDFTTLKPGISYYFYCIQDTAWLLDFPVAVTSFTYDGDGGRVKKTTGSTSTTYIGSLFDIQNQPDGSQKIEKHIFAGANRIATITLRASAAEGGASREDTAYYHSDHLGSSNLITNQEGNQIALTEFTPYGSISKQTGTYDPKHKFTGKELDSSTGLYYYGARYMDPELGRFISPDTIVQAPYDPQSLNRYSYCRNNPINYVDPTGNFWFIPFIIAAVKGALIGAAIGAAVAAATGQNIWQGVMTGAISGAIFGGIGFGVGKFGIAGFGKTAVHAFGGALSGTINTSITGGDLGMNALVGGLSAGASQWMGSNVPFLQDSPGNTLGDIFGNTAKRAATGAIVGGSISAVFGGEFGEGAGQGAMTSAIAYNANCAAGILVDKAIQATFLIVGAAVAYLSSPQVRTNIERATSSLTVRFSKWRWPEPFKDAPGPDNTYANSRDPFSWKPPPKFPNWLKWVTATAAAARFFKAIYDVYGPPQFSENNNTPQAGIDTNEKNN